VRIVEKKVSAGDREPTDQASNVHVLGSERDGLLTEAEAAALGLCLVISR
jgi:hypothetical protein